jgi:hypothetical protein
VSRRPEDGDAWRRHQELLADQGTAAPATREPHKRDDAAPVGGDSIMLATFPRGPRHDPSAEIVRYSLDTFVADDKPDKPPRFVTARRWYRVSDGSYRPTKAGITMRASELVAVIKALCAAARMLGLLPAKPAQDGGRDASS